MDLDRGNFPSDVLNTLIRIKKNIYKLTKPTKREFDLQLQLINK